MSANTVLELKHIQNNLLLSIRILHLENYHKF